MANKNLNAAKNAKNDEFYTELPDIEKELSHYKKHFYGKKILLNCDDPEWSNFWRYFEMFFDEYQLEKLTSTHYHPTDPTYKLEMIRGHDLNGDGKMDKHDIVKTPLISNGDFRAAECLELMDEADLVITNPPFSLFREYIATLMKHKKKFLVIGNKNAITCKEIFPLFMENNMWVGHTPMSKDLYFSVPADYAKWLKENKKEGSAYRIIDDKVMGRASAIWFTNLDIDKRHDPLTLGKKYDGHEDEYPKYDNYAAIEVSKVNDIPRDYYGVMGVPISYMDKYCPEQFEIIGASEQCGTGISNGLWNEESGVKHPLINGKKCYSRIFIRRTEQSKQEDMEEE